MGRKRRNHEPGFKAKVALAASRFHDYALPGMRWSASASIL